MRQSLGIEEVGQRVDVRDLSAEVERIDDVQVLLRLTGPVPGLLAFVAFWKGDGVAGGSVQGHFFSEGAPAFVASEQPEWKAWLAGLAVPAQ
jgi:hypothetical protein